MKRKTLIGMVQHETWTARMGAKYHGTIVDKYQKYDRRFRAGSAIAATVIVAGVGFVGSLEKVYPAAEGSLPLETIILIVMGLLALAVAIISGYAAALPPSQMVGQHSELRQRQIGLRFDFERLLVGLRTATGDKVPQPLLDEFNKLLERRREIERAEPRADRAILEAAQAEVFKELGFEVPPLLDGTPVLKALPEPKDTKLTPRAAS